MKREKITGLAVAIISLLVFSSSGYAQIPQKISYQGLLTDPSGNPVNREIAIVFSLYNAISGGTALWAEAHAVTVNNGIFNVMLGQSNLIPIPINLPFDQPYYLGIRVGSDAEMTPRQPVAASAYAISAARAEALAATATVPGSQISGPITTATLPAGNLTGTIAGSQLASGLTLGGVTAGSFSGPLAGNVTGNVTGNASGSAASFTGALVGDVTGTQSTTVVSQVGGTAAATVATGANLANAATSANTAGRIVKRDASGNFAAGTITATLAGNAATATRLATDQPLVQRIRYNGQTSRATATTSPAVKLRDLGTFTSHGVPATVTWTSAIGGSGIACNFQLRIDGTASGTVSAYGLVGNEAVIEGTVDAVPVTIVDVFEGLTAGTRMVELWYRSVTAACTENVGNYSRVVQVVEHGVAP